MAEKITLTFEGKGNAEKLVKSLTKSLDKMGDEAEKSSKQATSAFSVFQGTLASGIALKAIGAVTNAASKLFNTFITQGVVAAQVQEDAINRLNASLSTIGEFSKEASQDIQDFASSLQSVTTFGDEAIINMVALSQSFGFSAEQSKIAAEAAIQLSVAAGINLEEATRRVGRTISGSIADVSKFASGIKDLTKEELEAGKAANVLLDNLKGLAEAQTSTFSGASKQLANTFGDLTETTGFFVTKNPAVISAIKEIEKFIKLMDKSLKDNNETITSFVADAIPLIIGFAGVMLQVFGAVGKVIDNALIPLRGFIGGFTALIEFASGDLDAAKETFISTFEEIQDSIENVFNFEDSALFKAGENVRLLADKIEESNKRSLKSLSDLNEVTLEGTKKTSKAIKDDTLLLKSFEDSTNKERVSNLSSTLGVISQLQKSSSKELFAIGQAAAIGTATIDGLLAVQKALTAAPPPFSFVLAALVGAVAAINIAQIASQSPPSFASGSTFVEGTAGTDQIPALVSRGERIITTAQNADLTSFLSSEGGNTGVLNAILASLSNLSPGVAVTIGGDTLVKTLNYEIEAELVL